MELAAQDFKRILNHLGTNINVEYYEGDLESPIIFSLKSSLVTATEAAYNVTDREFLFKGDVLIPPENISAVRYAGLYFTRDGIMDKRYMILSMIEKPEHSGVGFMYAVQCNERINIYNSKKVADKYLNLRDEYEAVAENVPCYFSTVVRSPKAQNDGLIDQTIFNLQLPAKCMIAPMQRISRKEPKLVKKTDEDGTERTVSEIAEVNYQVDSVDKSLMVIDEYDGTVSGVLVAQLSRDLRSYK